MPRREIEYASTHDAAERIRKAFRNAPEEYKRRHFPGVFGTPAVPTPPPSRFAKRSTAAICGTLVGSVAPGLSVPVRQALDGVTAPEYFTRSAWKTILADVREGRRVDLRFGHNGSPMATTTDGTLRFEVHPGVGLMFEARMADDPLHGVFFHSLNANGAGISVGFRRARSKLVSFRGQIVRVIHHAELEHLAVIEPGSGMKPAYASAGVLPVKANAGREALRTAWSRCQSRAWEISKQTVRLTDLYSLE
jgi:phage head maturation protease